MFEYTVTAQDGKARAGELITPHGVLQTPVFMPVGTHGAVKSVSPSELKQVGSQIILANTYHMYLRPGDKTVKKVGGLHRFMNWDGPILTDSGGFQVFSLGERGMTGNTKNALRQVSEEGITFKSHLDGSTHLFTPEKSIEVQQNLGADIIMAFDQPVYGMSTPELAREAMERSMRWLERSKTQWQKGDTEKQALFGIVQGGIHTQLHQESARFVSELDLPGNAIGGLSVGEGKPEMWAAVESINQILPENKPRYFMGLGEPRDLVDAVMRGVDMFDCVSPSRLARHGAIWMPTGEPGVIEAFWGGNTQELLRIHKEITFPRINVTNSGYGESEEVLLPFKSVLPEEFTSFTFSALHHYIKENEMLGFRVLTAFNIAVLHQIVAHLRAGIGLGEVEKLNRILL